MAVRSLRIADSDRVLCGDFVFYLHTHIEYYVALCAVSGRARFVSEHNIVDTRPRHVHEGSVFR